MYDNATSLKMTSSFADHLTAGTEGVSERPTPRNHENHLLLEEAVSIHAIRGIKLYLLLDKKHIVLHRCIRCTIIEVQITAASQPQSKKNNVLLDTHKGQSGKNSIVRKNSQHLTLEGRMRGGKQRREVCIIKKMHS